MSEDKVEETEKNMTEQVIDNLEKKLMFSLWDNVEMDKRDISVVGMKKIMEELNISYSTLYRWCKKGI